MSICVNSTFFKCTEFLIITFEVIVKQVCDSNMDGFEVVKSKENHGQFEAYSPPISFEWNYWSPCLPCLLAFLIIIITIIIIIIIIYLLILHVLHMQMLTHALQYNNLTAHSLQSLQPLQSWLLKV